MQADTRICVADPENSCFFEGWTTGDPDVTCDCGSRIEGIGRPRMEPSFVPGAIDRMMKVPDAASVAAVRALEQAIGRRAGGSTGTGLWSALKIVAEMVTEGRKGSVVTLLCDPGDRDPQVLLGRVAGRTGWTSPPTPLRSRPCSRRASGRTDLGARPQAADLLVTRVWTPAVGPAPSPPGGTRGPDPPGPASGPAGPGPRC